MSTIKTEFDTRCLPNWARKDAYVVELCRSSSLYRYEVCNAKTAQYRAALRDLAKCSYHGTRHGDPMDSFSYGNP